MHKKAVFLINRTSSKLLKFKTLFELLLYKTPAYERLRVFECLAYAATNSGGRPKFGVRTDPCIFIGYTIGYKGYKLYHLKSRQFLISKYVTFHETILPFYQ
ncbi:hypothetical protein S83_055643 [Arachis hypogaea]